MLLIELNDRRVRTPDDVLMELNLPLVGVLLKSEEAPSGLLRRKDSSLVSSIAFQCPRRPWRVNVVKSDYGHRNHAEFLCGSISWRRRDGKADW